MLKKLCVLLILVLDSLVWGQLCSDRKSDDKCICKRDTDKENFLPITIADCRGINLNTFPDQSQLHPDINQLDLSFNDINSLDQFTNKFQSDVLKKLFLFYNNIDTINDQFFSNIPNLQVLDLSHNKIEKLDNADVFFRLDKLIKLDLSFNSIKELPGGIFTNLKQLNYLDLSYNPLGKSLAAVSTNFTVQFGLAVNITHIVLNNVDVTDLPARYFDGYDNLRYLSLADNHLELVPLVSKSLEFLDVSGNNLTFLSAHYLQYPALKIFKCSRMPSLRNVHQFAFYNMEYLEKLYINDCPNLEEFTEKAFGSPSKMNMNHPKYLSLARNGLRTLNSSFRYMFDHMYHVDLAHNPWDCNCDILWLKEYQHVVHDYHNIRCNSISDLSGKTIFDLIDEDLPQCYPEKYGLRSHRVLLVVLMLAIVLLIGLIAYLLKYPYLSRTGNSSVSPSSPYVQANTIET